MEYSISLHLPTVIMVNGKSHKVQAKKNEHNVFAHLVIDGVDFPSISFPIDQSKITVDEHAFGFIAGLADNTTQNKVSVVRYLREYSVNGDVVGNSGMTFYFVINYSTRKVDVGISRCSGETFVKSKGAEFARQNLTNGTRYMNLDIPSGGFHPYGNILSWFINTAPDQRNAVCHMTRSDIKAMMRMVATNIKYGQ